LPPENALYTRKNLNLNQGVGLGGGEEKRIGLWVQSNTEEFLKNPSEKK